MHDTVIFLKINTLKSSEVHRASTVSTGVRAVNQGSALTLRVWGGREDRGSDQAADRHSRLLSGTSSLATVFQLETGLAFTLVATTEFYPVQYPGA